jgi:hypothetical protein
MSASCFNNLIGIRGYCDNPISNLYIDNLPFINLRTLDHVITTQNSAQEYLQQKIDYATDIIVSELNSRFTPYYKVNGILENTFIGKVNREMQVTSASAKRRGISIRLYRSNFLRINLNSIGFYTTNYTGNVTFTIHNLRTSQVLGTFAIAVVANTVTMIDINQVVTSVGQEVDILISYDATGIDVMRTQISQSSSCATCSGGGLNNLYTIVNGAELDLADIPIYTNVKAVGNTSGIILNYTVECDQSAWLCSIKQSMAYPVMMQAAAEICRDVVNGTSRVNSVTVIDREKAKSLMEYYEMKAEESISNVANAIRMPNDFCFECKKYVKSVVRIP